MPGARRLAKTMDSRSGARATSSRAIRCTSGASSTRWKSSKMRTAPCGAMPWSSRMNVSMTASRVGPVRLVSASIAAVVGANDGSTSRPAATRWLQERDPVAIVLVEPVPDRPQSRPAGEVREERGLAVAGIGEHEDDALVDLRGQPIEQPMTCQGLLAQRRRLDLRVLDRKAAHVVAVGSAGWCGGDRPSARADGDRRTVAGWVPMGALDGGANDTERSWRVSTGGSGSAMAAMVPKPAYPPVSCEVPCFRELWMTTGYGRLLGLVGEQRPERQRVHLAAVGRRDGQALEAALDVLEAERRRPAPASAHGSPAGTCSGRPGTRSPSA